MCLKKRYKNQETLKSFLPYYGRYKKILIFDLFCAALTTLGELILPLMLRLYHEPGECQDLASMTSRGCDSDWRPVPASADY